MVLFGQEDSNFYNILPIFTIIQASFYIRDTFIKLEFCSFFRFMGCHSNGNTKHENWSTEFNRIFSSFCLRRKNDFFRWAKQPNANSNHQYSQVCGRYFNPIQKTVSSKIIGSKKFHHFIKIFLDLDLDFTIFKYLRITYSRIRKKIALRLSIFLLFSRGYGLILDFIV